MAIHPSESSHAEGSSPSIRDGQGVLHCCTGNFFGGVESYLATLARNPPSSPALKDAFLLGWEGTFAETLRRCGATPEIVGPSRFSRPWTLLRSRFRLGRSLRMRRPGLVMVHSAWTHALYGPVVRRLGIPLGLFVHTCLPRDSFLEKAARRIPLSGVAANSRYTADSAVGWYPGHPVPTVLRLPVPTPVPGPEARRRIRASLGTPESARVILQASRITRGKGLETLIEAVGPLARLDGWECWIAGTASGPDDDVLRAHLGALAGRCGVADRIRWLGFRSDMPDVLAAADIGCQVNDRPEAFGLSLAEAMLAGLAVVGPSEGGIVETLSAAGDTRVAPGDSGALSRRLRRLLEDPVLLAEVGRSAQAAARRLHDPEERLAEHRAWFGRLAGDGETHPRS